MRTVEKATAIILRHAIHLDKESVPLEEAYGRILREPLTADRDFPPFDRVTMDGIGIQYAAFADGLRHFSIRGIQAAGGEQLRLKDAQSCLEVMTGAITPEGVDTVIRYEDLAIAHGTASVEINAIKEGQNIHRKGSDRKAGEIIVAAGCRISAAEIAVAATVGKSTLEVTRLPRVVILSTGDELVGVDETPLPHQIRTSNAHAISQVLAPWGIIADRRHLVDDPEVVRQGLQECLDQYDVILLSGGVSAGKFDYVPQALEDLGAQQYFHKVSQRPGKPFWFGGWQEDKCVIFALPGNPVSSFVCTLRYVLPWLRQCLGLPALPRTYAVLATDYTFKPNLTYFLQVNLVSDPATGRWLAKPIEGHGSGDLANLVDADGFLELPKGEDKFRKGEVFPFFPYRPL
ncbi:MAG: molybdopterin molybdotransferase MoeA [Lewinellaceae bacterium]|nr:molybdopterin molybdotransferase MoeA [Lewinellaceae bacterium]